MNADHQALREALCTLAGTGSSTHQGASSYVGSPHQLLSVTTPDLRRLAKRWVADRSSLSPQAILAVADEMFDGSVHEEKTLAALILRYSKPARCAVTPARIDIWLEQLVGWAEIDALCSNIFQAEDLLGDWATWEPCLRGLRSDPNINKRRASLVLLTGPVRRSDDPRLLVAAFGNVERLQAERAVLITKAVSWLLRNLSIRHRDAVARYMEENRGVLPAIVVREVSTKLQTGRKNTASRS